jgi:hypothetical protein
MSGGVYWKNKWGRVAGVEHVILAAYRCSVLCKKGSGSKMDPRTIFDEEQM